MSYGNEGPGYSQEEEFLPANVLNLCCLGSGLVECRGKVMGDRKEAWLKVDHRSQHGSWREQAI